MPSLGQQRCSLVINTRYKKILSLSFIPGAAFGKCACSLGVYMSLFPQLKPIRLKVSSNLKLPVSVCLFISKPCDRLAPWGFPEHAMGKMLFSLSAIHIYCRGYKQVIFVAI